MTPSDNNLMMIRVPAVLFGVAALALAALGALCEAGPFMISDHPQLFLDDHLVRSAENLKRAVRQPKKHAANPLIVREHPWERRVIEIYGTILFDAQTGTFRCWYLSNEYRDGIPDNPAHPRTAEYATCYAESVDGVRWTKPMVGLEPFGVHTKHNIVIAGTHGFCVMPTPDDPEPQRRYKGAGGAVFGFSPDGIRWDIRDWRAAVGKNDTSTCVVRWKGEYLAYVRAQVDEPEWPGVMRGVGLSVSQDFEHWTQKKTVFTTDAADGYPWTQPYGISVTPYGDVLIGILWLIHLDRVPKNNGLGHMDTQLVVSRDGRTWGRVADRALFLQPTPDTWDAGRVFPGTTMFVRDDKVHIYYTGVNTRHGEGWGAMGIGLASLPADRFVALEPEDPAKEGILETHPLSAEGTELLVNADVVEDGLHVELLDGAGKVLAGYARQQSRLIRSDPLRWRVVWGAGAAAKSLEDVRDKHPFAMRFILSDADLYAFQIVNPTRHEKADR